MTIEVRSFHLRNSVFGCNDAHCTFFSDILHMNGIMAGNSIGKSMSSAAVHDELFNENAGRSEEVARPKGIAEAIENDAEQEIVLEKSNILLLGPTGSGMCGSFCMSYVNAYPMQEDLTVYNVDSTLFLICTHQ